MSCKLFTSNAPQSHATEAEIFASNLREIIDIDNREAGAIQVSLDAGASWKLLGKVVVPYDPHTIWYPVTDTHKRIPYFNLITGASNVMVVDPEVIHLRIDNKAHSDAPLGLDVLPRPNGIDGPYDSASQNRSIVTDLIPGETIFSGQWSPDIGSQLFIGSDSFEELSAENIQLLSSRQNCHLRIAVKKSEYQVTSVTFENKKGGSVTLEKTTGEPVKIAEVQTPISGTGRYSASAFSHTRGAVVSQGVAHLQISVAPLFSGDEIPILDPKANSFDEKRAASLRNRIAGFELTMVDHFHRDEQGNPLFIFGLLTSNNSFAKGGDVNPVLEGAPPLFWGTSFMAEGFRTQYSFKGETPPRWYDIDNAKGQTRFPDVAKLVGVTHTAFENVAAFRFIK